jgi:aminopeptidase N
MPIQDPLFHPVFLGRRAAMDTPPFEPFPPTGRSPWSGPDHSRRDLDFHVRHYKLTLQIDLENHELRGRVAVTIESLREELREAALDAAELRIELVRAGKRTLPYVLEGERIRVTLPRALGVGQKTTFEISYSTRPRKGIYFVGPTEAEPERTLGAWTQGQADDTHWWMPCLESTESRATHEQIITVPSGYRVVGNGRLVARHANRRAGTVTWHWKLETTHPAYLTSLVVGKYVELLARAGAVPLQYYVPKGREKVARTAFKNTPRMIANFSRVFGHPYAFTKYAQTLVPDFTYGGMENTSATTLFDRMLEMPGDSLDEGYDMLIAHELAHQWWGDLVTCRDWSEGWLNEGFATYSEIVTREDDAGMDDAHFGRLEQMCSYLVEDGSDYRRALVERRYEYPTEIFDRHLYEKGALVLHMLRATLSDSAWRRSLKRYVRRHAFGPVETADLRRACEDETGRNLMWFFDQWVHAGGHPELKVERRWGERARCLTLTIEQIQPEDGGLTPAFRLPMTLEVAVGTEMRRIPIEIRERKQTIQVPLPSKPRYVALDPEHHVMKLLDFPRADEELLFGLERSAHPIERIRCARELAARSDERVVEGLLRALKRDKFWGVRAAAAVSLGEVGRRVPGMADRIAPSAMREHTRVRRAVIWALGWLADESAQKHLRRVVAKDASTFNVGWALIAIARAKPADAFERITSELPRPSHRDMLQVLGFDALALLKDRRAVDLFLEHTSLKYRNETRAGATKAIGKMGVRTDALETRLIELLRDRWFRVRNNAAWSLWKIKSPKAEAAIASALREEALDMTRVAMRDSLEGIRKGR